MPEWRRKKKGKERDGNDGEGRRKAKDRKRQGQRNERRHEEEKNSEKTNEGRGMADVYELKEKKGGYFFFKGSPRVRACTCKFP